MRNIIQKRNRTVGSTKRGFTPDYPPFWENHGKTFIQNSLPDNHHIVGGDLISLSWIQKAFNFVNETSDLRYLNKLLHVAAFEMWYRLFVTREMSENTKI